MITKINKKELDYYNKNCGVNGTEFDNETVLPNKTEYLAALQLLQQAANDFSLKSQFTAGKSSDEIDLAIYIQYDADNPSYVFFVELSNRKAVSAETVHHLQAVLASLSPYFRLVVQFEYNYLGFDFTCIIEQKAAYCYCKDRISAKLFGL